MIVVIQDITVFLILLWLPVSIHRASWCWASPKLTQFCLSDPFLSYLERAVYWGTSQRQCIQLQTHRLLQNMMDIWIKVKVLCTIVLRCTTYMVVCFWFIGWYRNRWSLWIAHWRWVYFTVSYLDGRILVYGRRVVLMPIALWCI